MRAINQSFATRYPSTLSDFVVCVCVCERVLQVSKSGAAAMFTAVTGETAIFLAKRLRPLPP